MSKIAFVTDSTSYIPHDWAKENDVTIVPLSVNFGEETYREGFDIDSDGFFQKLSTTKQLPTTSQPAVGEFIKAFEELIKGHDHIVGVFLSAGLSGTYNAAETASRMVERSIHLIDSKITSFGISSAIREGVRLRDEGKSIEEVVERVQYVVDHSKAYIIVDSLDHLARGGRISGVAAKIGSLLQVKPILHFVEGKFDVFEKVRTRRKALDRIIEVTAESRRAGQPFHLCVAYTRNIEDAQQLRDRMKQEFPDIDPGLCELGPVLATHVGPGVLAVVFWQ